MKCNGDVNCKENAVAGYCKEHENYYGQEILKLHEQLASYQWVRDGSFPEEDPQNPGLSVDVRIFFEYTDIEGEVDRGQMDAYYCYSRKSWYSVVLDAQLGFTITHWMPLPSPPKDQP